LDVDEPPVFTNGPTRIMTISENQINVGVMQATDPEGDQVSFTLEPGPHSSRFFIDPNTNQLKFFSPPNYEELALLGITTLPVQVRAEDSGGHSSTQMISVV